MLERLRAFSGVKIGVGPEVVASLAIHAAIVGGTLVGGGPEPVAVDAASSRPIFYIPMNRAPAADAVERVVWAEPGRGGGQEVGDVRPLDEAALRRVPVSGRGPEAPGEIVDEAAALAAAGDDSVLMAFEVDSEVVRDPASAGPEYPAALISSGIQGKAEIQFIVDTTGRADTLSFKVLDATHPEFAASVRRALPGMRFQPAVVSSRRVRQLVQQAFVFKLEPPAAADSTGGATRAAGEQAAATGALPRASRRSP